MLLIIAIRLLGPLIILRFPLFGAVLSIFLDYIDLNLLTTLDSTNLGNYQYLDKILDFYYLGLEAYISMFWKNVYARAATFTLFIHRTIGIVLFAIFGNQALLVLFPNVFEPFFLIYLLHLKLLKKDRLISIKRVLILVILIAITKLLHEYLLHINTTHPWFENKYIKYIFNLDKLR